MEEPYTHPAFPQPDDLSVTLWRYMDATRFVWLATWQRLVMPRADLLGDPFEGTTPQGELDWWRQEVANAADEQKRRNIEYNRNFLSRMANMLRNNYFVSCWHMNRHENHAMWRCYTRAPEAVAVITTYENLRECLPNYVYLGIVRYIDYATQRLPTLNMFEYIMHKRSHFEYEREVRAVAVPPVDEHGRAHFLANLFQSESLPDFEAYAPTIDVKKLIRRVVLHPEAGSSFKAEIAHLCAENALPASEISSMNCEPLF
jgi:hypothetical protein